MATILTPLLPRFEAGITADAAWALEKADTETNSHLRDGDQVELLAETKGDFDGGSFIVPRGTLGSVAESKAPRAEHRSGESSHFFAVVEVIVEGCSGVIRVPHAAPRIMTQPTARPDSARRRWSAPIRLSAMTRGRGNCVKARRIRMRRRRGSRAICSCTRSATSSSISGIPSGPTRA